MDMYVTKRRRYIRRKWHSPDIYTGVIGFFFFFFNHNSFPSLLPLSLFPLPPCLTSSAEQINSGAVAVIALHGGESASAHRRVLSCVLTFSETGHGEKPNLSGQENNEACGSMKVRGVWCVNHSWVVHVLRCSGAALWPLTAKSNQMFQNLTSK